MDLSDDFEVTMRSFRKSNEIAVKNILAFLKSKPVPEIKKSMENMPDDLLNYLCNELAMTMEDYEICQAATEVMAERIDKNTN